MKITNKVTLIINSPCCGFFSHCKSQWDCSKIKISIRSWSRTSSRTSSKVKNLIKNLIKNQDLGQDLIEILIEILNEKNILIETWESESHWVLAQNLDFWWGSWWGSWFSMRFLPETQLRSWFWKQSHWDSQWEKNPWEFASIIFQTIVDTRETGLSCSHLVLI